MTDRILFKAYADTHTIAIRTVTERMKSPQRFLITYEELDKLRDEGRIVVSDIRSFLKARVDKGHDWVTLDFSWLTGHCYGRVEGFEQTVYLRWSKFQAFLRDCRQPDGLKDFKAMSLGPYRGRPRLVFDGNKANLRAAVADRRVRHKLGKALTLNFNWPDSEKIVLTNDFVPFSFFFQEFRGGNPVMCGGLILHGQEDMSKAYYGIHT